MLWTAAESVGAPPACTSRQADAEHQHSGVLARVQHASLKAANQDRRLRLRPSGHLDPRKAPLPGEQKPRSECDPVEEGGRAEGIMGQQVAQRELSTGVLFQKRSLMRLTEEARHRAGAPH